MNTLARKLDNIDWRSIGEWLVLLALLAAVSLAVSSRWEGIAQSIAAVYRQNGPVTFILLPLSVALVSATFHAWSNGDWHGPVVSRAFYIVAVTAPMTGFLGTTLGLMAAISALGEAATLDSLLQMVGRVFEGMGMAFATTVWGLCLGIAALTIIHGRPDPAEATEHNPAAADENGDQTPPTEPQPEAEGAEGEPGETRKWLSMAAQENATASPGNTTRRHS